MNYIPNTDEDRSKMLSAIGEKDIESLFRDIPEASKSRSLPDIPEALDEISLVREMKTLSDKNTSLPCAISFLGGGAYNHFIPSVVRHITSRSEFYTAYTPYQAEMSQGLLQAIYEYQTMVCNLTGMDVSSASHYDGGTALAEAAVLSCNHTGRREVLVSEAVNPNYREVLKTYSLGGKFSVVEIGIKNGVTDTDKLRSAISEKTACVILQLPNFFGCLEEMSDIERTVHSKGALFVTSVDPISLGILASPREYRADVVVAEGQSLGNGLNFGGPYLGIFAVRKELVRLLPGRVVGLTQDHDGKRGFVLTLQAREQHIRREKAASNICSNQAMCALAAAVYLSCVGEKGLRSIAGACLSAASYAKKRISSLKGYSIPFSSATFKEFVVKTPVSPEKINKKLFDEGIIGGFDLGREYKSLEGHMLFCFTEMNTKADIDRLISVLSDV